MSYNVNEKELRSVLSLDFSKRYAYFIKKVCDWEEIWSLRNEDGWVVLGDSEGNECFPVWPAKDFAAMACQGDWKDCEPSSIPLDKWLTSWIDGLRNDQRLVAVFPNQDLKSSVVSSDQLRTDMQEELAKYG
ncbi:MAG: DUF2750 domain-containing protein [Sedimentisphaerales bacterium]|nr:DUF2750 domain-containing protein [Sedimentisphaerales bacterium]